MRSFSVRSFRTLSVLIYLVENLFQTLMDTKFVFVLFLGQKVYRNPDFVRGRAE